MEMGVEKEEIWVEREGVSDGGGEAGGLRWGWEGVESEGVSDGGGEEGG